MRRIWSEFVPYDTLRSQHVMQMLFRRGIQPLVAVTPSSLGDLSALTEAYADAGMDVGLWPMVNDDDGRWGSTFNAGVFSDFVRRVVDASHGAKTIALDLEPPIHLLRRLVAGDVLGLKSAAGARPEAHTEGQETLRALTADLGARGCKCLGVVNPMLLGDQRHRSAWQWLLGTPIDDLPFDALSFMAYTSLFSGYSKGLLSRRVAVSLLAQTARAARAQWNERASLSLGSVGVGALGDERPYRWVAELSDDVAVARGCGVDDLALFDLSGVLRQPHPEAWLDAFVYTPAATRVPRIAKRARILKSIVKRASHAIETVRRIRLADA
ncbi:MAG: hypothetical protein JRH20_27685 [Deltaproteobacteria bacterium]|nr:hypothetical protein [Deltaproteobacteria bacterium]